MFQVKAKVIGFKGDTKLYPCHFDNKVGDEFIFDGEKFIGRVCPMVMPVMAQKMFTLFAAGPNYRAPIFYMPFWYQLPSVRDLKFKKYDGVGWRALKEFVRPNDESVARRLVPNTHIYPPHNKRDTGADTVFTCDDFKTGTTFKLEAFDVSDKGQSTPFFRKQMLILNAVQANPGIKVEKITSRISREHVEDIYPGLFPVMLEVLSGELEQVGHLKVVAGKATITAKGKKKLADFRESITTEELKLLGLC